MTKKRPRRTPDEWKALVDALSTSGQKMSEFARQHDISTASLSYWMQKEAVASSSARARSTAKRSFSEIVVVPPRPSTTATRLEVVTRSGTVIRIEGAFDAGVLRGVLGVVESC